ncbi:SWIB/MDM2 domain-containing protein [Trametes polyzona]|nr:SWIB/MDM2 domain-containing protein [Trametes polyzona]
MSFDPQSLEPQIREILSAPDIDLAVISAKRVRRQLLERNADLSPELVKDNKDDIDQVISRVYEEVSRKRKREDESEVDEEDEDEDAPRAKPKKAKQKREQTDEEVARQLSNEINGRARTSRTAASGKTNANGAKRGGKKGPKSSATVASDGEEGDEPKPKKRGGGFTKEYILSEPLAALLGVEKLSRPQTVKQLWNHIKANNMQNPENRKEIICDDGFKEIFKCDRIDMFKMNKELTQHLHEAQAEAASS